MVGEGGERWGLRAEAEEARVGAGAEGDDLFPGSGGGRGGEEAVDEVVDGGGADIRALGAGNIPSASRISFLGREEREGGGQEAEPRFMMGNRRWLPFPETKSFANGSSR